MKTGTSSMTALMTGAAGATVSTVMTYSADVWLVLPAVSVAVAVKVCVAFGRAGVTSVQSPEPSAVAVPITLPLRRTVTTAPASAVPASVGVVSLVEPPFGTSLPIDGIVKAAMRAVDGSSIVGGGGGVVSSVRVRVATGATWGLPMASVWVAVALMLPSPSEARSDAVSETFCAAPVPVRFFVIVVAPRVNVTTIAAPLSPVTVTTPPAASTALTGSVTPARRASKTAAGEVVSSVKEVVDAGEVCGLPAASVCVAETLTVPSPSVARSALESVTGWADPVPVSVFVTVFVPRVNVTTIVAPVSPVTLATPEACVASAAVAPLAIPVPRASVTAAGGVVSRVKEVVEAAAVCGLPARSVWVAETFTVPLPSVVTSAVVSVTGCGLPVPVRFLVTVAAPRVNVTTMAAEVSPVTVTTPEACVASDWVAPLATPVPRASVGAVGATVSSVKEVVAAAAVCGLPAESV